MNHYRLLRSLCLSIVFGSLIFCTSCASRSRSPQATAAPSASSQKHFNVRSFGATGDGKTLDSPAINRTIAACAAAGGGTVFLPAGKYLSGSIRLTNNLNLFLDAGAVIVAAPQNLNAYDETEPWEGTA